VIFLLVFVNCLPRFLAFLPRFSSDSNNATYKETVI